MTEKIQPFQNINPISAPKDSAISPKNSAEAKVNKAAEDFEALLLHQMLQTMWSTVPKNGLFESKEEGMFQDMLTDELAHSMAREGKLGIARIVEGEMKKYEK